MTRPTDRRRDRGVSLIEALVALVVMAFGTLAVLGVQSTLRANADTSKQRAEAVRIAQEVIEDRRAFAKLDTGPSARYTDIVTQAPVTVVGINASFLRTETVVDSPDPRIKTLTVDVSWVDRTNQNQVVRLSSSISGVAPELAGSLSVPADTSLIRNPRGRHVGIPIDAIDQGNGTSKFTPPNSGGVKWVFNNRTGYINSICNASDICVAANAWLLAGYVRFSTDPTQPGPAEAEGPLSFSIPTVEVVVDQTVPAVAVVSCFEQVLPNYVRYYCAVPVAPADKLWSGRSYVSGISVAASIADSTVTLYRVCRYTAKRAQAVVPADISNAEHPLDYVKVKQSLSNQNFLVIRAGDGTTAFDCPDTSAPALFGTTWHHQPAS